MQECNSCLPICKRYCGSTDRLEDLDFADDLCLLSEAHGEMQTKLGDLIKEAGKVVLAINAKKTKALRVNTNKTETFMLGDESIEDVESFVYLGSKVTKDGGATQDVAQRIQKAKVAFVQYNFTQYGETATYILGPNFASFVAM